MQMNYAVENENFRLMSKTNSRSLFKAFAYIKIQMRERSPCEGNLRPKARMGLTEVKTTMFYREK